MDEKKQPQPEDSGAQKTAKPLSEKRKAALLRYMAVLFCAAFILVLVSLILQMHSSEAKISELNEVSTSALSNAEALQTENRTLQDEKIALEKKNEELQEKIDELTKQLEEAAQAEEDSQTAENEVLKNLRTELDRTKEAYEALLVAKNCEMHEGNVTFSKAMDTLADLEQYLGTEARAEYEKLLAE